MSDDFRSLYKTILRSFYENNKEPNKKLCTISKITDEFITFNHINYETIDELKSKLDVSIDNYNVHENSDFSILAIDEHGGYNWAQFDNDFKIII